MADEQGAIPEGMKLKPCPFCGGTATMMASNGAPHGHPLAGGTRVVECDDCYASGPAEGASRDGSAWNRRTPVAAMAIVSSDPIAALAVLAPPKPPVDEMREAMYSVLRRWDVGDFSSRVCSGKGHGSLPADICEAELDAFGEEVISAIRNLTDDGAGA